MIKKIITLSLACIITMVLPSCKKYLDVNQNPNVVTAVDPKLLLPSAELAIGSALGVDMNNNAAIWVQYWTQSVAAGQYKSLEQYQPTANIYDRVWSLFYAQALPDLQKMQQQAAALNLKQYQAISMILQAYSFQLITDAWGDVPFSEALKGQSEDGGITSPKFDRQQDIYDGIITMVDNGLALINTSDPNHPTTDDLIYGGDMNKWKKFANTLRLKIFMRLSEVNPSKAQAGVSQTITLAGPGGFIDYNSASNQDAQISYISTSGNQNPLYVEAKFLGQNQVASATSIDTLKNNADPRIGKFYAAQGGATFNGQRQGITVLPGSVVATIAYPSANTAALVSSTASATAPVRFMTSYESKLLQAEAVARGWGGAVGSDSTLFKQAIIYNFLTFGVDTSSAAAKAYLTSSYWGIYPANGNLQQKIRHIITQKWFCMNGNQAFEAWTEWRRTRYPDFLVISASSQIGNKFPVRFIYPDVEVSRNANFPGQKSVTDRVYWDIH
jgi:hypothetical protein